METLPSRRPLVVFNLVDAIEGDGRLAPRVPARLDALGIAYTGWDILEILVIIKVPIFGERPAKCLLKILLKTALSNLALEFGVS